MRQAAILIGLLGLVALGLVSDTPAGPETTIQIDPAAPEPDETVTLTTWNEEPGDWTVNGRDHGNVSRIQKTFEPGQHRITLIQDDETVQQTIAVAPEPCEPYSLQGNASSKADVVFVARGYTDPETWERHLSYYLDLDQDNRGLFHIYPMNETIERFNLWTLNASNSIGTYNDPREGRGLIKDARRDWFPQCSFADYHVLMSKTGFNHSAFAYRGRNEMYIPGIAEKMERRNGAVALPHEWGHGFGGLKDEYYSTDGRDAHGPPNCADNRSQAEQWWGGLAETSTEVGYYEGCAYTDDNIRPHEQSIMGNGGLWRYGPVNDRKLWQVLDQYH